MLIWGRFQRGHVPRFWQSEGRFRPGLVLNFLLIWGRFRPNFFSSV